MRRPVAVHSRCNWKAWAYSLTRAGLPTDATDVDPDRVLEIMQLDKKTTARGLSLVLLEGIGKGVIVPAPSTEVLRAAFETGHNG